MRKIIIVFIFCTIFILLPLLKAHLRFGWTKRVLRIRHIRQSHLEMEIQLAAAGFRFASSQRWGSVIGLLPSREEFNGCLWWLEISRTCTWNKCLRKVKNSWQIASFKLTFFALQSSFRKPIQNNSAESLF